MAHKNKVLQSINMTGEHICVDIFCRPDGTYGFNEYRRDPEDPNGWFNIGYFDDQVFTDEKSAFDKAKSSIPWLNEQLP